MKDLNENKNIKFKKAPEQSYSYYSRILKTPFDTLEQLQDAEASYLAEQQAKEDKLAQKKADAQKVEEAFKAMNAARKDYKENLVKLTADYAEVLKKAQEAFEADKTRIQLVLADAEAAYSTALKEFSDKYPEGYHVTLKDGDFETTISRSYQNRNLNDIKTFNSISEMFDSLFGCL